MLNKISRFFILLAILSPVVVARELFFPFITGKVFVFRLLVTVALFFFLLNLILLKDRKKAWKNLKSKLKNPIIISAFAFLLAFLVTGILGDNPSASFWSNFERGEGGFQMIHYFLFFVLIVLLFQKKKDIKKLIFTHIGTSILISLYAIAQLYALFLDRAGKNLGIFEWILARAFRVSGTLGNPSYLSAYLLFTLALLVYLFIKEKSLPNKISLSIILVFESFIFLKTGTKGAFLAALIGVILILSFNIFIQKKKSIKVGLIVLLAIPILSTSLFLTTPNSKIWTSLPVVGDFLHYKSSLSGIQPRFWTWGSAVAGVIEKPIAGWGSENFAEPFDKYYNPNHFGLESFFDRTHNLFLEYLISGGLLLFIPWLLIFFFYYKSLLKKEKDFWYSILFAVPIIYFVQGFFLFDVFPIYLSLFLFLAFYINTSEKEKELDGEYSLSPIGMGISILVLILLSSTLYLATYKPYKKNILLVDALKTESGLFTSTVNRPSVARVREAYVTAYDEASPVGNEEVFNMYVNFVSKILDNVGQANLTNLDPVAQQEIANLLETANTWYTELSPYLTGVKPAFLLGGLNIRTKVIPALSQETRAKYGTIGENLYKEALEIAPTRIEFLTVLLRLALAEGDEEAKKDLLPKIEFLRPDLDLSDLKG